MRTLLMAIIILLTDQGSKWLVKTRMAMGESMPLIPKVFHLTYVENAGAAFGIMPYKTGLFIFVTIALLGVAAYFYRHLTADRPGMQWALGLAVGGALGNLTDRLSTGYVVDFFDFRVWPVFNLADTAIVIGMAILFVELMRMPGERGEGDGVS